MADNNLHPQERDPATAASEKPRRERGSGRIWLKGNRWWVQYYDMSGRQLRESSRSAKKMVAEQLLRRRLAQREAGLLPNLKAQRVLVEELAEGFLRDYRINKPRSLKWGTRCWTKHLRPVFGDMLAAHVSTDDINRYIERRKAAPATINRELACLKRMFSLGYKSTPRKVQIMPVFPARLTESAPRAGFVVEKQYAALCANCHQAWLRALLAIGYNFGFRKGELLGLRVRQVDLLDECLVLEVGTTKNGGGRKAYFNGMPEIKLLLQECVHGKAPDDHLFTREDGTPGRDLRDEWIKLCARSGLTLTVHDLRRSAVRNMVRRGVSEKVAMRISGHKTRSVFDRYDITNDDDLREASWRIANGANSGQIAVAKPAEGVAQSAQVQYNQ